jgi:hypothetical protein
MKTRYDEPSIRISIIITDREHIFRWGRTRRSHERFSRRKWDRSWRYRRSVDYTTATNDGPPKEPESSVLRVASARTFEICLRIVLPRTRVCPRISFTGLDQAHELLGLRALVRGMTSPMGCAEYSVETVSVRFQRIETSGRRPVS